MAIGATQAAVPTFQPTFNAPQKTDGPSPKAKRSAPSASEEAQESPAARHQEATKGDQVEIRRANRERAAAKHESEKSPEPPPSHESGPEGKGAQINAIA